MTPDDQNDFPFEKSSLEGDDRLVHALLSHVYEEHAIQRRDDRIQRVIAEVGRQSSTEGQAGQQLLSVVRRTRTGIRWVRPLSMMAAAVCIIIGLWALTSTPSTAAASINRILATLGAPGDRTYRISLQELPKSRGPHAPQDLGTAPRPGLDEAVLYLRDGNQYVLARRDPHGGWAYDGFNGRQSWRVRRGRVEEVRDGLGAGRISMPPLMADVPFTDLRGTLERIRSDYRVEQSDSDSEFKHDGHQMNILASRNSRWVKGPKTIDIWADAETGVPHRIVFDDAKVQGSPIPCRITLSLQDEKPLPADWFAAEAHVGGQ